MKGFARKHPHSMGAWSPDSASHVATMSDGDFRHSEASVTLSEPAELRIEHVDSDGTVTVLRPALEVLAGEIVDGAVMRAEALDAFLAEQIADAKATGVLFSIHLKATMMKVSDPILFGHAVRQYFADVFAQHGDDLTSVGAGPGRRPRQRPHRVRRSSPPRSVRPSRRRSPPPTTAARPSRWSTPTAASPTSTCRAT